MKEIRNSVIAFVIFGMLVGLCILIYSGFEDSYSIIKGDTKSIEIDGVNKTGNIMDQLERLNLVEGMNEIGTSIEKIGTPSSSLDDILGALAGVGIGVFKTITGVITLPVSIGIIIIRYYQIPPIIYVGISIIFSIIIGFTLLSAYLRSEV